MQRVDVITYVMLAAIGPVIWLTLLVLDGCAANQPHVQNEIEAIQAGGDYGACTAKIKAQDGGTFRDWERCACDVDRAHHVDSGKCGP